MAAGNGTALVAQEVTCGLKTALETALEVREKDAAYGMEHSR